MASRKRTPQSKAGCGDRFTAEKWGVQSKVGRRGLCVSGRRKGVQSMERRAGSCVDGIWEEHRASQEAVVVALLES